MDENKTDTPVKEEEGKEEMPEKEEEKKEDEQYKVCQYIYGKNFQLEHSRFCFRNQYLKNQALIARAFFLLFYTIQFTIDLQLCDYQNETLPREKPKEVRQGS